MSARPRTSEDEAAFLGMGKVVAELRERRSIDRKECAEEIGEECQMLERLERGEVDADWGTLRVLARTLEVPLDKLIEMAEEAAPGPGGDEWRKWSREAEARHVSEHPLGSAGDYQGALYASLIRDCLRLQLLVGHPGGILAFEDEPVRPGLVRLDREVSLRVTRVHVEDTDEWTSGLFEPLPFFRFEVFDDGPLPQQDFVIEIDMALEALASAHPDILQIPLPVYLVEEQDDGAIRPGTLRHLSMSLIEIQRGKSEEARPRAGIRFEVAEEVSKEEYRPLYSFTMEGFSLILAMSVPALGDIRTSEWARGPG